MKKRKPIPEKLGGETEPSDFERKFSGLSVAVLTAFIVLVGCGVWQRVDRCDRFPSMFHTMRQYTSTLRARDIYLAAKTDENLTDAERAYVSQVAKELVYEPPVSEFVVAMWYRMTGTEAPWISTYLATMFWSAGALLLFDIVTRLGWTGVPRLAAVGFFMTSPLGIIVCRTFQPEPLMLMGFLLGLWLVLRFGYPDSWKHAACLGMLCGIFLLAKPGFMLFPLCAAVTGLGVSKSGWRGVLTDPGWYLFGVLCALPSLLWIQVICAHQQSTSFMPGLLAELGLWQRWVSFLQAYYGITLVSFVALGVALGTDTHQRLVCVGMFVGYLFFVIATNYRSMTHSYYSVALLPVIAIAVAPLMEILFRDRNRSLRSIFGVIVVACWCISLSMQARAESQTHYTPLSQSDYDKIAKTVGVGGKVVAITDDYSRALKFHSYLDARNWPSSADISLDVAAGRQVPTMEERLREFRRWGATHFVAVLSGRAMGAANTANTR
ncbi:MAG: glycosyltransferase family 39 protein [Planctomycetota bacterium]